MSKHLKTAIMLAALAAPAAMAQSVSMKTYTADSTYVIVTPITDYVIKVSYSTPQQRAVNGTLAYDSGLMALTQGCSTAAVYNMGTPLAGNSQSLVTAAGLTATLNMATGQVVINGGSPQSVASSLPPAMLPDGHQQISISTTSSGSYYGAGERGHSLNLSGDTLVMYNRQNYGYGKGDPRISQMNITMPLCISSDGFAILFDDFAPATMVPGQQISYDTESQMPLTYYYIKGEGSIADAVQRLSELTGRQPLPPLWSLGYITSKYGYRDRQEAVGAIDTLQTQGYPVDGIVLDLYWYGQEQDMGRLAWDPEQWPDAAGMLADLKGRNVNLVAISQPYVLRNGRGIENYNYLAPHGMLMADSTGTAPQEVEIWVGEGGMLDVSNPQTRAWLADTYRQLTDMGITGWWGDLGEPEVHPQTGLHHNGLTARQYHNKYGNDWSSIIYDMFSSQYPDTRLLTMMRGGTTGLQRYSVFPWSTDVARSWAGLQPQITIMLNSGLSGLGYMGHDVGGFAVDPEAPYDPELYVRWLQLGLFSPMLRTHAQQQAEPYHYPQYADIILPLIKERYRWLPYNYTLAYENAALGYPLVRPLNFTEPGVNAYDTIDDEYLWGSEVLVAPVMQQGATSRPVTFPEGTWVDYANPAVKYAGGSTIEYPAPLHVLPLFVRAGAFLPMADYPMASTADYDPGRLTVEYFPVADTTSEYTLYDDNRISASSLQTGAYRLISFSGTMLPSGEIGIAISSQGSYPGAPAAISISMVVRGLDKAPAAVYVGGKKTKAKFSDGNLTIPLTFTPGTQLGITIK